MMFVIAIIPLILGMAVVILALIRKLKPQVVSEKSEDSKRNNISPADFTSVRPKDDVLVKIR